LGRKYSGVKQDVGAESTAAVSLPPDTDERVFSTNEGPVVITVRDKLVFVSESFDLDMAHKLAALLLDAQGTGDLKMAQAAPTASHPHPAGEPLTAGWVRFFADCGVMKAAVDAAAKAGR
jgi:hypothetical protein